MLNIKSLTVFAFFFLTTYCSAQPFFSIDTEDFSIPDPKIRSSISLPVRIKLVVNNDILKELNDIEGWTKWEVDRFERFQKETNDLKKEGMGIIFDAEAGINFTKRNYRFLLFEERQSCGTPYFQRDEPDPYLMIKYVTIKGFGINRKNIFLHQHLFFGYTLKIIKGNLNFAMPLAWEKDVIRKVFFKENGATTTDAITTKLGLDMDLVCKTDKWKLSVIGRNLNSPHFSYPQKAQMDNYCLKPEVKIIADFNPLNTMKWFIQSDLTQNKTLLQGYETMNLSGGIEIPLSWVILKGQTTKNLLSDDIGWIYTMGIGAKIKRLQIDMLFERSGKTTQRSKTQKDYPSQIQGYFQIFWE